MSEPLFQRQGGEVLFTVSHLGVNYLDDCGATAIFRSSRYAGAAASVQSALQLNVPERKKVEISGVTAWQSEREDSRVVSVE
jgi:hypothetical protein